MARAYADTRLRRQEIDEELLDDVEGKRGIKRSSASSSATTHSIASTTVLPSLESAMWTPDDVRFLLMREALGIFLLGAEMSERRQLRVVGAEGSWRAEVTIATEPPWVLRLALYDGFVAEAEASDLFSALERVRRQLEARGLRVCCQGSCPDVWPSGMARQMGAGRRAYRLRAGQRATMDDLVDIFDPAECGDVVTVEEQREEVQRLYGD